MTGASEFSFDEGSPVGDTSALARLRAKVVECWQLEQAATQMEEDLKAAKRQLHVMRTSVLPDLMAECGMDRMTGRDGWEVKVEDFVSGSLPSDPEKREAALKYLEGHDGAGLIRTTITMHFSKSQHNEALALADDLKQQGQEPVIESSVHAQSLQAYARERLRGGEEIDPEVLGLFTGRVAKFKQPKERAPRKKKGSDQ